VLGVIRREKKLAKLEMPRSDSKRTPVVFPKSPVAIPITVQRPSLLESAKEGFGLGIGVSIARNIVDRAFSSIDKSLTEKKPLIKSKEYMQCMDDGGNEEMCTSMYKS
jgi:hypothetical protein